jgi:hypothetical protein
MILLFCLVLVEFYERKEKMLLDDSLGNFFASLDDRRRLALVIKSCSGALARRKSAR